MVHGPASLIEVEVCPSFGDSRYLLSAPLRLCLVVIATIDAISIVARPLIWAPIRAW